MKKLIILLALLPCLCLAKCPTISTVKIVCKLKQKSGNVKTKIYLHDVTTRYHKAFPECIINDPRMVTKDGNFRIDYIVRNLCGLKSLKVDKSMHFSFGVNWFFGKWLPSIPMFFGYTPQTNKYEMR